MKSKYEQFDESKTVIDLRGVRTPAQIKNDEMRKRLSSKQNEKVFLQSDRKEAEASFDDVVSGVFRVAGIMFAVVCAWTYLPNISNSLAYFTDTEGSVSEMATGFIDLIVSYSHSVTELECGEMKDPEVEISAEGNKSNVSANVKEITGSASLCGAIDVDVRLLGETIYSGPLQGFYAENIENGTMRFVVSLPDDAGPFPEGTECTTSVEYIAMQSRHGGGFSDSEIVDLVFSVDSSSCDAGCGDPCDTCGDLYVDITNINNGTTTNDIDININTGGSTANGDDGGNGGDGGDGGNIQTGSTSASVIIENILNDIDIDISQNECCDDDDCGLCEDECTECGGDCNEEDDCGTGDEEFASTTPETSNDEDENELDEDANGAEVTASTTDEILQSMQDRINERLDNIVGVN